MMVNDRDNTKKLMERIVSELDSGKTFYCFVIGNSAICSLIKEIGKWNKSFSEGKYNEYPFSIDIKVKIGFKETGGKMRTGFEFIFFVGSKGVK